MAKGKKSHGKSKANHRAKTHQPKKKSRRVQNTRSIHKRTAAKKINAGVRIAADTKYWLFRDLRKNPRRASYSTKSLRSPRDGLNFTIKKKQKDLDFLDPNKKESWKLIWKEISRWLGVTPRTKKELHVFIKVLFLADLKPSFEFYVSAPRQKVFTSFDVLDILQKIRADKNEYEFKKVIIGYEAEVTIHKEKLQRPKAVNKRRKKTARKIRSRGYRSK